MKQRNSKTARNLLSTRRVVTVKDPGQHSDGGGLYLQVQDLGDRVGKSWVFRYTAPSGRRREMGLGPLVDVSIAEARVTASECRRQVRDGRDPLQERRQARDEARAAITFEEAATGYIAAHSPGWTNAKHKSQWENTLATYATPVIGKRQVAEIGTGEVLKVLEPIWNTKRETARRMRARLERIFSWAAAHGYRSGENPARWDGNLKDLLPRENKTIPVRHHPALPYHDVHGLWTDLQQQPGYAAQALQLLILTAARTGEVIAARWSEIDFEHKEWAIPGERMKTGRPHKVPLCAQALAILEALPRKAGSPYLFPGHKRGTHLSNMAMAKALKRMGRTDITVHGFRSTFRDWAAERTAYPNHVAEMALAHVIGDKVERAYRRGELLEKRTALMADWARYIEQNPAKGATVSPIRGRK